MARAWSIITLGDDRQYGGNTGYADMPGRQYRYDSNVANHRQLASGDLVVVRDREVAQGLARIVSISEEPGTKIIQRCPECNTTSIKRRPTMSPPWRCAKGHVFGTPIAMEEAVVQYTADFGDTFQQLPEGITAQQLKGLALRPNDQISIEELDLAGLEVLLQLRSKRAAEAVSVCAMTSALKPDDAAEDSAEAPFEPSTLNQRRRVLREIATRRGQRLFRNTLIRRYNGTCVVTKTRRPRPDAYPHLAISERAG